LHVFNQHPHTLFKVKRNFMTAKKYGYFHFKYSSPDMFNRIARSMLVGDHCGELRKVDGNKEHEEDIDTLCRVCDAVKTAANKDYLKAGR